MKILFPIMAAMISASMASAQSITSDSITNKKLDEVVVEASMQHTGSSVTTYYPGKNAKRTAQNVIDLLNQMAIPQISVNPVGGSVETPSGEEVAIYIDMEPATQEEKDALRAEDVKKVEYLAYPSDPRFNHEKYVINITLRHYDYGGYAKISGTGNAMADSGSGLAYAKTQRRRMTFDLNVTDKYTDRHHTGTEQQQIFRFPETDGTMSEITRSNILEHSRFRQNQAGVSIRAKYTSARTVISNSVYFTATNTPNSDSRGQLLFSTGRSRNQAYSNSSSSSYLYPRWRGSYYFDMGNGFSLNAIPSLFYQHTRSHRSYSSRETSIITDATENAITGQLQFQLNKKFLKYHTVDINLLGIYYYNQVNYSGNTVASPEFNQFAYGGILGYSFRKARFYGQLITALAGESNRISGVKTSSIIPEFHLNAQYSFNQRHSISVAAKYSVKTVEAADKTPDMIQENELLYKIGNVNLRNTRWARAAADYTWLPDNRFALSASMGWRRYFKHPVPVFTPVRSSGYMLRSIENNGDYQNIYLGSSFTARLLRRSLVVKATPQLWFEKQTGLYSDHTAYLSLSLTTTYYIGRYYFSAFYSTTHRELELYSLNETSIRHRPSYQFKIGWSNGLWNLSAAAVNIFRSSWLTSTSSLKSQWFDQYSKTYSADSHQFVSLTASYTFGFGRKVKHGDEIQNLDAGSSAIMQ